MKQLLSLISILFCSSLIAQTDSSVVISYHHKSLLIEEIHQSDKMQIVLHDSLGNVKQLIFDSYNLLPEIRISSIMMKEDEIGFIVSYQFSNTYYLWQKVGDQWGMIHFEQLLQGNAETIGAIPINLDYIEMDVKKYTLKAPNILKVSTRYPLSEKASITKYFIYDPHKRDITDKFKEDFLNDLLKEYNRPFEEELVKEDSLLIQDLKLRNPESEETIAYIKKLIQSRKYSNPCKLELAKLLLNGGNKGLDAYFSLFTHRHNNPKSIRAHELSHYPVACAAFQLHCHKDNELLHEYMSTEEFWNNCELTENMDFIVSIYFRYLIKAQHLDFNQIELNECGIKNYALVFEIKN